MTSNFSANLSWMGAEGRCGELCDYLENNRDLAAAFDNGYNIHRGNEEGSILLLSSALLSTRIADVLQEVFDNFSDLSFFLRYEDDFCGYAIIFNGKVVEKRCYDIRDGDLKYYDDDEEQVNTYINRQKDRWNSSWRYTPEPLKTRERCMLYMVKSAAFRDHGEGLLPKEFWNNEDFCAAAAVSNGEIPGEVPRMFRDACKKALEEGKSALEYLPQNARQRYAEDFLSRIKNDPSAMEKVPASLVTADFCRAAVEQSGYALASVPEALKTPELCLAAAERSGGAIKYVPEHLKTPELCLAAVRQNSWTLEYVPEALKTPEFYHAVVKQDGLALQYVPEALKTAELCLAAVEQKGGALDDVPEALRTPELCRAAVGQIGHALQYVPERLRTPELCLAAVEQDGRALKYVPAGIQKQVRAALMRNQTAQ